MEPVSVIRAVLTIRKTHRERYESVEDWSVRLMWCSRGCLGPHATSVACLWHVSVAGGARRRGCAAGGVSVTFNRLLGEEVVVPLDPSIKALLAEMAEQGAKPFEELSVPEARVAARAFAELQGPPEDVA